MAESSSFNEQRKAMNLVHNIFSKRRKNLLPYAEYEWKFEVYTIRLKGRT